jgi:hypothetical protein
LTQNISDVTIGRASCKLATPHPLYQEPILEDCCRSLHVLDRHHESMEVAMSSAFHFLEVLVISVVALVALTLVLLVIVAHLPDSPLKAILAALAKRIGATAAISLLAGPLEPIPGVDVLYDVAGVVVLAIYWFGMFKAIAAAFKLRAVTQ